jgi:hypothetical protein
MNITCTHLEELDDGGAIVSLEMDDESKVELINMGFIAMLQNYIAQQHAVEEEKEEELFDWDEEEEEEEAEADPYAAVIAELKTCYEYYALVEDDEEGKTAELAHAASQLLTLYMGEEAAADYFWSVSASVWNDWAD